MLRLFYLLYVFSAIHYAIGALSGFIHGAVSVIGPLSSYYKYIPVRIVMTKWRYV